MNRRHPIDDLFRSRLEEYGKDAPMHLWDAIERSRMQAPGRRRRGAFAMIWLLPIFSAFAVGAFLLLENAPSVEVGSFPIPMQKGETNAAQALAENAAENTEGLSTESVATTSTSFEQQNQPATFISKTNNSETKTTPSASSSITQKTAPAITIASESALNTAATASAPMAVTEESTNKNTTELTQQLLGIQLQALEYEDKGWLKRLWQPDPKCARFSPGNWYHYLDLTLTPGLAFRKMEAVDSEYERYLEEREKTETTRYTYGAGARLSAVSSKGLAARAGINYTSIVEEFNYVNENEVRTIITDVFDMNGQFIRTDTSYLSGSRHKISSNQYQIIDIPLAVGYDFRHRKFDLLLSAGVRINLLFMPKGAFLSPNDLTPVNFSYNRTDAYPAFKTRLGTAWFFSAGLAYKLNTDFHLLFEPNVSYYPGSFTRADFPVSQRYWLAGASIGIRRRL